MKQKIIKQGKVTTTQNEFEPHHMIEKKQRIKKWNKQTLNRYIDKKHLKQNNTKNNKLSMSSMEQDKIN